MYTVCIRQLHTRVVFLFRPDRIHQTVTKLWQTTADNAGCYGYGFLLIYADDFLLFFLSPVTRPNMHGGLRLYIIAYLVGVRSTVLTRWTDGQQVK